MVDVKELKENYPDSVLVLNVDDNNLPDVSDLAYRSVPVHDVEVGSYILVGAGEVCDNRKDYIFLPYESTFQHHFVLF